MDMVDRAPNIVVTRSFSKAFSLASVRIGYMVAQEGIINDLRRVYNPKSVNLLAQIAGSDQCGDDQHRQCRHDRLVQPQQDCRSRQRHRRQISPLQRPRHFRRYWTSPWKWLIPNEMDRSRRHLLPLHPHSRPTHASASPIGWIGLNRKFTVLRLWHRNNRRSPPSHQQWQ